MSTDLPAPYLNRNPFFYYTPIILHFETCMSHCLAQAQFLQPSVFIKSSIVIERNCSGHPVRGSLLVECVTISLFYGLLNVLMFSSALGSPGNLTSNPYSRVGAAPTMASDQHQVRAENIKIVQVKVPQCKARTCLYAIYLSIVQCIFPHYPSFPFLPYEEKGKRRWGRYMEPTIDREIG